MLLNAPAEPSLPHAHSDEDRPINVEHDEHARCERYFVCADVTEPATRCGPRSGPGAASAFPRFARIGPFGAVREVYPVADQPRQDRAHVANLRVAYGLGGPASRAGHSCVHCRSRAPSSSSDCQALLTEDQSQALLILTDPPRTEASDRVALLRVLGQEQFTS